MKDSERKSWVQVVSESDLIEGVMKWVLHLLSLARGPDSTIDMDPFGLRSRGPSFLEYDDLTTSLSGTSAPAPALETARTGGSSSYANLTVSGLDACLIARPVAKVGHSSCCS